jgi:hypothetical protein
LVEAAGAKETPVMGGSRGVCHGFHANKMSNPKMAVVPANLKGWPVRGAT